MSKYIPIEKFNGFDIQIEYEKVLDEYAEKCKDIVKQKSPDGNRRNNKYKDGWTTTAGKSSRNSYMVTVWNATNWQLTHLLENGHIIANKKGGNGWASPRPHIDDAYKSIRNKFIKAMQKVNIKIDAK